MIAVAVCFVSIAVAFDLKTDRIPNALNLAGLAAGLLAAYERAGPTGLLASCRGVALMFAAAFALYVLRAIRGGDGKMLCALTAMLGVNSGFKILLTALVSAAMIGLPGFIRRQRGDRTKIHCSVPIAIGTALNLLIYGGV